MKKNFEQPELMVVRVNNHDIVTRSLRVGDDLTTGTLDAGAGDRMGREDWDAGY